MRYPSARRSLAAGVLLDILFQSLAPGAADVADAIERGLKAIHANAIALGRRLPAYEQLIAVGARGDVLWTIEGTGNEVVIAPEYDAALHQRGARIVLLHNHPSGASLSAADLEQLSKPGVERIIAVGHDGSVYTAAAGTRYQAVAFFDSLYPLARGAVAQQLRIYRPSAGVTAAMVDANFGHLVALALQKAEIIRYAAILPRERHLHDPRWMRLSGVVASAAAARLKKP